MWGKQYPGMVMHTFNTSTREAEGGRSLEYKVNSGLQSSSRQPRLHIEPLMRFKEHSDARGFSLVSVQAGVLHESP